MLSAAGGVLARCLVASAMVARYYRELLNFCARWTKDRDAAADVVQESYARVLKLERARVPISDPRALLYQTARHVLVDEFRREQRRDHADVDSLAEAELPRQPTHLEPDARLATRQSVQAYLATIEALPPRCREAFVLSVFDGLSQRQIAERMGTSLSMIEKHIARARLACRDCERRLLEGEGSGPSAVSTDRGQR